MTIKECKFKINKIQNEIDYLTSTNESREKLQELTNTVNILNKWLDREIENIRTCN